MALDEDSNESVIESAPQTPAATGSSVPSSAIELPVSDAPAPVRTPRKRATRARTTRAAATEPSGTDAGVMDTIVVSADGVAEVAAPASAPTETAPDTAAQTPAETAETPAPAKRTRAPRKRAVKAVTTVTADATQSAEPADAAPAAEVPEPADVAEPAAVVAAPVAAPARRRRRSTAPAGSPTETAADVTSDVTTSDATPAAATPDVAADAPVQPVTIPDVIVDELDLAAAADVQSVIPNLSDTADADADESRAGAVFAMPLFQAPEPVAPRRRRSASRPAGAPSTRDPFSDPAAASAATDPAVDEQVLDDPAIEDQADVVVPELDPVDDVLDEIIDDVEELEDDAEDDEESASGGPRRRRRRGGRGRRGRGRGEPETSGAQDSPVEDAEDDAEGTDGTDDPIAASDDDPEDGQPEDGETESAGRSSRRRRRRRRGSSPGEEIAADDPPNTVTRVRESRESRRDEVTGVRGSTRLEAKKQRRREGREAGRKRTILTEAEFLARRESVDRRMIVREREGRTQIGVLEDGVLVEHYVARKTQNSMVGNVYLGRVQNVLPSMEAAFVDIGKGRNAVLYAGEVNWDAAGLDGQPRRIEHALTAGEAVLVQVTKDPIGHKGARLTSQISMPGRYLVYVPGGSMTGISRKLPDTERTRLKKILREIVPEEAGVIVRTAAEGASDGELERDVARLQAQWDDIQKKQTTVQAPALLYGEPDLAIRVVRDIFNEDFGSLMVSGEDAWDTLQGYVSHVAPDLAPRLERWTSDRDVFAENRIDEQLAKAMDRKVWLPSGGSLVIDRTEAMTVVDVNTGKFTGSGGNLEETVTKNNIEAAEEVVRQLRLRDIGGIIVIDFIDMVLESNRELVLRRLLECLGRDRTRHQVAEVTSLGLVQMTRKRVGQGLLEVFSETCEHCGGRGLMIHDEPVEKKPDTGGNSGGSGRRGRN